MGQAIRLMPLSGIDCVAAEKDMHIGKCFRLRYDGEWNNSALVGKQEISVMRRKRGAKRCG